MCFCMYVCVCVCLCVYVCLYVNTHILTHSIHADMNVYTYIHVHTHTDAVISLYLQTISNCLSHALFRTGNLYHHFFSFLTFTNTSIKSPVKSLSLYEYFNSKKHNNFYVSVSIPSGSLLHVNSYKAPHIPHTQLFTGEEIAMCVFFLFTSPVWFLSIFSVRMAKIITGKVYPVYLIS